MHGQVSSGASSPGKVPFSLLRRDWWCWVCQDSSMQRVWVWFWVSIIMAFDRSTRWFAHAQQEERILGPDPMTYPFGQCRCGGIQHMGCYTPHLSCDWLILGPWGAQAPASGSCREERTSALHISVPTTARLWAAGWWEWKHRYWSVWVALRYTEVQMKPSSLFRRMSRKVSWLSDSLFIVNCMQQSILFRWSWKESTRLEGSAVHVSLTYLLQNCGLPKHLNYCFSILVSATNRSTWESFQPLRSISYVLVSYTWNMMTVPSTDNTPRISQLDDSVHMKSKQMIWKLSFSAVSIYSNGKHFAWHPQ